MEGALGPVEIIRYFATSPVWPQTTGDRPLNISFKWAPRDVLAGRHDAEFAAWCSRAPEDRPTWWTYWHEPENEVADGTFTAADYRAAWRRLTPIARATGNPMLRATLVLMEWNLQKASGRNWRDYYPGADVLDVFAWDCYYRPSQKRSPADVYAAARAVSVGEGLPWAVAETAVSSNDVTDPAERRRILTGLSTALAASDPAPVFVCYFDSEVGGPLGWNITRDPAAAAAWNAGRP